MESLKKNVRHLIVDSGAFIRNAPIKDLGEEIYSVVGVVDEIRDKATRERLQVLPYQIHMKDPQPECLHAVSEFAKKTGDYKSLSAVDLRVLALTYQLHKQHIGAESIRTEPVSKVTMIGSSVVSNITALNKNSDDASVSSNTESVQSEDKLDILDEEKKNENDSIESSPAEVQHSCDSSAEKVETISTDLEKVSITDKTSSINEQDDQITSTCDENKCDNDNKTSELTNDLKENNPELKKNDRSSDTLNDEDINSCGDSNTDETADDEEDDDDDSDWITPQNFSSVRQTLSNQAQQCEEREVVVACLTTDFAMQNVLLQMGLHLISVDGLLIRRTNNYVLRCTACFKVTTDMRKEFCYHCGNRTLRKVATSVDADGTVRYHISRHKKLTARGLRYTLPAPRGGKQANNPILCEDQKPNQGQKQTAKSRMKYEALNDDYIVNTSPFAPTDVSSRSAVHRFNAGGRKQRGGGAGGGAGGRGGRKNPNENSKVYGRRK